MDYRRQAIIISNNVDNSRIRLRSLLQHSNKCSYIALLIQDPPIISKQDLRQLMIDSRNNYETIPSLDTPEQAISKHSALTIINIDIADISCILLQEENPRNYGITGISLQQKTPANTRLDVYNIYIRPRAEASSLAKLFKSIREAANRGRGVSRSIIAGDINAPVNISAVLELDNFFSNTNNEASQQHYTQIKLNRSRTILREAAKLKLTILNRNMNIATYSKDGKQSIIDTAMVGNKAIRQWTRFEICEYDEKLDGHRIIHIGSKQQRKDIKRTTKQVTRLELINSRQFLAINLKHQTTTQNENWKLSSTEHIRQQMNNLATDMYSTLKEVQRSITTTRVVTNRRMTDMESRHTRRIRGLYNKIKNLRKAAIAMKQRRLTAAPILQQQNRAKIDQISAKINTIQEKIITLLTTTEPSTFRQNETMWEKNTRINQKATTSKDNQKMMITEEELQDLAELKFPKIYRINDTAISRNIAEGMEFRIKLKNQEIDNVIYEIRNKKYTGIEGVKFTVFNKATNHMRELIRTICKMSFWTSYTPDCCRTNTGKLIPKKTAGQFRIVHIGTPLSCMLEQIALHRLEYILEARDLYSNQQYGFMPKRSRHDLITRLIMFIKKHNSNKLTQLKTRTTLISLDIEGAFDNVNQDVIIEKLMSELDPDPIRIWLSNFIINRQIIITIDGKLSETRQVCKGVPQGSSLGPILWNYTINQIDWGLRKEGSTEILAYADDLIIAINGNDKSYIQRQLNETIEKIKQMKLSVNPEKSTVMVVYNNKRDFMKHDYKINGQAIRTDRKLQILGIPITDRMRIDNKDEKLRNQINKQIIKLAQLNQTGLFKTYNEWKVLLDSYLFSTTVMNNLPILAIDEKGRKWMDKIHIKSMKLIFNWPNNISEKLTRLITGTLMTETLVRHMIRRKTGFEQLEMYNKLAEIMYASDQTREETTQTSDTELTNTRMERRKFTNPELTLNKDIHMPDEQAQQHPTWHIIEGKSDSWMVEWFNGTALQMRAARNMKYPICHFNTLTLIWHNVEDDRITNRHLTMSESNTLYQAMKNNKNHDWRIILTREKLIKSGWTIKAITHEHNAQITRDIGTSITVINQQQQQSGGNNIEQSEEATFWTNTTNQTNATKTTIQKLYTPDTSDYRIRGIRRRAQHVERSMEWDDSQTFISKTLNKHTEYWQSKTSPNLISSATMIMLTGLYNSKTTNKLERGTLAADQTPEGCNDRSCTGPIRHGSTSTLLLQAMTSLTTSSGRDNEHFWGMNMNHITLHRALECPNYSQERDEIDTIITETARTIPIDDLDEPTRRSRTQRYQRLQRESLAKKTYLAIWDDPTKRAKLLSFVTRCTQ